MSDVIINVVFAIGAFFGLAYLVLYLLAPPEVQDELDRRERLRKEARRRDPRNLFD